MKVDVKKAFTIVEVIIVCVILGVLAAVAIPKVMDSNEKIISSEGQHILTVLLSSQKRYLLENNTFATIFANLDFTSTPKYFDTLTALDGTGANGAVGQLTRIGGSYTLSIGQNGIIYCAGAGCGGAKCNLGAGANQCNQ